MWKQGINFRATSGYVTDGAGFTSETSASITYPTTTPQGNTVGWAVAPEGTRDRSTSVDSRLAGMHYTSSAEAVYRIDLPEPGTYSIRMAIGDQGFAQLNQLVEILDNNTVIATILDGDDSTTASNWFDAKGNLLSHTDWPTYNEPIVLNFSSTTLKVRLTSPGSGNTVISSIEVEKTSSSSEIQFIGATYGESSSVTLPPHQAGDLIVIMAAWSGSNTAPGIPSTYQTIDNALGGSGSAAGAIGYKIATSSSEVSDTWTNANYIQAVVYRGVDVNEPIGNYTKNVNWSNSIPYSASSTYNGKQSKYLAMGFSRATIAAPLPDLTGVAGRVNFQASNKTGYAGETTSLATSWSSQSQAVGSTNAVFGIVVEMRKRQPRQRINLIRNPIPLSGGYTITNQTPAGGTVSYISGGGPRGTGSVNVLTGTPDSQIRLAVNQGATPVDVFPGEKLYFYGKIKAPTSGISIGVEINWTGTSTWVSYPLGTTVANTWVSVSAEIVPPSGAVSAGIIQFLSVGMAGTGVNWEFADFAFTSDPEGYFDGNYTDTDYSDYEWVSTINNSYSRELREIPESENGVVIKDSTIATQLSGTSISIRKPITTVGDFSMIILTSSANEPAYTLPSGWTQYIALDQAPHATGNVAIYYKIAESGDSDVTITVAEGSTTCSYIVMGGVDTSSPFDTYGVEYSTDTTLYTRDAPAITLANTNEYVLRVWSQLRPFVSANIPLQDDVISVKISSGATYTNNAELIVAGQMQAASGTTGVATLSSISNAYRTASLTVGIKSLYVPPPTAETVVKNWDDINPATSGSTVASGSSYGYVGNGGNISGSIHQIAWVSGTSFVPSENPTTVRVLTRMDTNGTNLGGVAVSTGSGTSGYQAMIDTRNSSGSSSTMQLRKDASTVTLAAQSSGITAYTATWYMMELVIQTVSPRITYNWYSYPDMTLIYSLTSDDSTYANSSTTLYPAFYGYANVSFDNLTIEMESIVTGPVLKYWTGYIWTKKPMKVRKGSSWEIANLKMWNGTGWVQVINEDGGGPPVAPP